MIQSIIEDVCLQWYDKKTSERTSKKIILNIKNGKLDTYKRILFLF
jgi:hypothetical protein